MAMQEVKGGILWPHQFWWNTGSSLVIDAASEKAAFVFQVPETAAYDRVWFYSGDVITGGTVDVRLETVDASGVPSGTLVGTNTNASVTLATPTDDFVGKEVTLTAAASLTRGQWVALVIANPAVSNPNTSVIRMNGVESILSTGTPYTALYTGSWSKSQASPIMGLRADTGTWVRIRGAMAILTRSQVSYQTASSPDEYGNKIVIPFGCKVSGVWLNGINANFNGDFDVKLYDSTNTVLAAISLDKDYSTEAFRFYAFDDDPPTLTAGATYRITLLPTTGSTVSLEYYNCATGLGGTMPGGGAVCLTTRTDAGSWTDTAASIAGMGLIISHLDDAAGGGGSSAPSFAYAG